MKESKKTSAPCHQEHVLILNSLTESLREELKRGLTLMDNCVNQLAQAKWILINVEKTIEDSYATCPACDPTNRTQLGGNTATSPPSSVPSNTLTQSNGVLSTEPTVSAGGKKGKARKASILPMVSGHTIQRPNLNITRIDAKGAKKQKAKNDPPPPSSTSRVRGRGQGSALLASANAGAGFVTSDSDVEAVAIAGPSGANRTDNDKKKKAGPMSRTRVKTQGAASEIDLNGPACSIDLLDIRSDLHGKCRLVGAELAEFMRSKGMRVDFKIRSNKGSDDESLPDVNSGDSDANSSASRKKKLLQKKESTLSNLISAKKNAEPASAPGNTDKRDMKTTLQSSLLNIVGKQSKAALLGKFQAALKNICPPSTTEVKKETNEPIKSESSNRAGKKGHSGSDSDSDGSRKKSKIDAASPARKRSKLNNDDEDSDMQETEILPTSKRAARKSSVTGRSSSKKSVSCDESDDEEIKTTKRQNARKGKKRGGSSDDSDFEPDFGGGGSRKGRSKRSQPPAKRHTAAKVKSKEIIIDSSSDDEDKSSTKPLKTTEESRDKMNSQKVIRGSSDDEKSEKSVSGGAKDTSEKSVKPAPVLASRPGPASQKAKRSGGRPGPLSSKSKQDNSNESPPKTLEPKGTQDQDVEDGIATIPPQASFSDSDSEDSELQKIRNRIPLNLQDAARSPSPDNHPDIFGRLVSRYCPVKTPLQKLRDRCTRRKSEVYELGEELQNKLSKAGRELLPYNGSFTMEENNLESGKYYLVGTHPDEKLVLCESNELQRLELSEDELDDLIN